MENIEVLASIRFRDENGNNNTFTKGENIDVVLKNGECYKGFLTFVGQYSDGEVEPVNVICVDTSRSRMSYSMEIIRFTDIKYLYKNENGQVKYNIDDIPPFADILKYVSRAWKNSSPKERKEIIEMIAGMK